MVGAHRSDLEFAEAGELGEVPLATLGARLAARVVDLLIVFVVTYFPLTLFIETTGTYLVALYVTLAVYDAIFTVKTGTPPGKRMGRIKVVNARTGAPPGWGAAVVRAVTVGLSVWIVTAVIVFLDEERHRGVHDRVAGTLVVAS
jgi:uncharacterized RDD family membrane protein YckC